MADRSHLSIGEVLSLLREEFPDVTISKIRFLESQGLVDPERTPSGYRKFYDHDIERLRWILRQQRENFLPLKVIRGRLAQRGGPEVETSPPEGPSTAGSGANGRAFDVAAEPAIADPEAPAPDQRGAGQHPTRGGDTPAYSHPEAAAGPYGRGGVSSATAPPAPGSGHTGPAPPSGPPRSPDPSTLAAGAPPGGAVAPPAAPPPPGAGATGGRSGGHAAHGGGEQATAEPEPTSGRHLGGAGAPPGGGGVPGSGGVPGGAGGLPASSGPAASDLHVATPDRPSSGPAPSAAGPVSSGTPAPGAPARPGAGPTREAAGDKPSPVARPSATGPATARRGAAGADDSLTLEELVAASGLPAGGVADLQEYGLIGASKVGGVWYYDDDALAVARAAAGFARHGVEARHLRAWRNAADREASLFEQVVVPLLRQRNPESRQQAVTTLEELTAAGSELHAALLRRALRSIR